MKGTFFQCLWVYTQLAFFRASPQQLPWNWSCAVKAFLLYVALNLFLLDSEDAMISVIFKILIEIGLLSGLLYIGLKTTRHLERFNKTLSALIGAGTVISAISVILYALISPEFYAQQEISQTVINLTLILLLWNLAVVSIILKRSLSISTWLSVFLTFNYFLTFELILMTIFGGNA